MVQEGGGAWSRTTAALDAKPRWRPWPASERRRELGSDQRRAGGVVWGRSPSWRRTEEGRRRRGELDLRARTEMVALGRDRRGAWSIGSWGYREEMPWRAVLGEETKGRRKKTSELSLHARYAGILHFPQPGWKASFCIHRARLKGPCSLPNNLKFARWMRARCNAANQTRPKAWASPLTGFHF